MNDEAWHVVVGVKSDRTPYYVSNVDAYGYAVNSDPIFALRFTSRFAADVIADLVAKFPSPLVGSLSFAVEQTQIFKGSVYD
jgi:hypothetical protein